MTQNDATRSKSATKARPAAPPGEGWGEGIGRLGALGWSVQGGPHCLFRVGVIAVQVDGDR